MTSGPINLPTIGFQGQKQLGARADVRDVRDFIYRPRLSGLARQIDPRKGTNWWTHGRIRDQGTAPNCVAHALAGIVDHLLARDRMLGSAAGTDLALDDRAPWTSAKMLYRIAQFHDEFPGEKYSGSSIRGVLRGFYFNGACSNKEADALGDGEGDWHITRAILESARRIQLGSYYRVRARLPDVHGALNEAGLMLVSADIHRGWMTKDPVIGERKSGESCGRHAFIVIGYNEDGFLVQNSWGRGWGDEGVALWSYRDWSASVVDQWVLHLAVPLGLRTELGSTQAAASPVFRMNGATFEERSASPVTPPNRFEVLGHVASLSRGRLDRYGPYHADFNTLTETVRIIKEGTRYKHVLIHFMGLQKHQAPTMMALRDAIPVFLQNGVYPFFVSVENELSSALHHLIEAEVAQADLISGEGREIEKDRKIETRVSGAALRIVEEIQNCSMRIVYDHGKVGEGVELLDKLFGELNERYRAGDMSYHFSAHGFGALLLAELIERSDRWSHHPVISSVSLLSPIICPGTVGQKLVERMADRRDLPVSRRSSGDEALIESLDIYCQSREASRCDLPFSGYGGNWPELWSQVFAMAAMRGELDEDLPSDARDDDRERKGRSNGRYVPLLAQPVEEKLADDGLPPPGLARALGHDVARKEVRYKQLDAMHRDFDLRPCVLDTLLQRVLGGRDPVPKFSTVYPDRESLLREWNGPKITLPSDDWFG